jgi:anaerobic selenocysteine-containing dehydrogenase
MFALSFAKLLIASGFLTAAPQLVGQIAAGRDQMPPHKSYRSIRAASCRVNVEARDIKIIEFKGEPGHPVRHVSMFVRGRYSRELYNGEDRLVGAKKRSADGAMPRQSGNPLKIVARNVTEQRVPRSGALAAAAF